MRTWPRNATHGSNSRLHGRRVAIDTAPLIYYIEQTKYVDVLDAFFAAVASGDVKVVASMMTLLEVLVHPLKTGNHALATQYNDILLSAPNVLVVSVTVEVAQEAAQVRAETGLKTPDAIIVATAQLHDAVLLTNDRDFSSVNALEVSKLRDLTL